jgi:hypothetical protein
MRLGEILVRRGVVTIADIDAAINHRRTLGGRLGENLIALGRITAEQLSSVVADCPAMPRTLAETGISHGNLLNLMLKFMHLESCEIVPELADRMKLPYSLVQHLMDDAVQRGFVQALGSVRAGNLNHVRFALATQGQAAVTEAMRQNLYLGPAPVPLSAFQRQVQKQRITNEPLDADSLKYGFSDLVVPQEYIDKLLPAINAGRTILLFGPPGYGKTSIATRIAGLFRHAVHIPYAVEVDGQIIRVFDASLHQPSISESEIAVLSERGVLHAEGFDDRWAMCLRPVAIAGGELSLSMIELRYNPDSKYYDAPLHVKALNGVLLIDDFGRQQIDAKDLLDRWVVPMESRVDYLKLNTGKSFSIPFDELLIFCTNLNPADLMHPAFLRRIPYKIRLAAPTPEQYREIFDREAQACGLELTDEVFDFVVERLTLRGNFGLAHYQPKFICDQVVEACRSRNLPLGFTNDLTARALANLYVEIEDEPQPKPRKPVAAQREVG